jgi:hypothetical protein
MKRLLGLGMLLVILVGALSSHEQSRTTTTTGASNEPVAASLPTAAPKRVTHHGTHVSYSQCDQNISVGPNTTCGFADNVFRAYARAVSNKHVSPANNTVEATSPVTGRTYTMACRLDHEITLCTGGHAARVRFPLSAAESYYSTTTPTEGDAANSPYGPAGEECTNGSYTNSAGNTVCSPEEAPGPPPGATAECADGTYSFSESRSGTCSHHGGVASWL